MQETACIITTAWTFNGLTRVAMNSFSRFLAKIPNTQKSLFGAVLVAFLWLTSWYWHWQAVLQSFIWLRLGIGLALFILPGACLYGLLTGRSILTFNHLTFGFVISHLLAALLGTLGRIVHLSFGSVKFLFILVGLIPALIFLNSFIHRGIKVNIRPMKIDQILPLLVLFLVAGIASLVVIQRVLGDDDLTYLAYLTNWQNSIGLNFNDIIFGEAGLVHPRFWIMSAPFAQALLADIARVPGILLLSGYYEPFLVILAVLSWYELACALSLSPRVSSASAMLQLAFLLLLSEYLHPGAPFFKQLSADKATAAFIMAPVFFQSLVQSLKQPAKRNWVTFLLAGLSLTFMHPVILAYSVFIGGMLILFNWKNTGAPQKTLAITILIIILLPQVALRFIDAPFQTEIPYTTEDILSQSGVENMVTRWRNTQYYGFNPAVLEMNIPYQERIPIPTPILARGWLFFPILALLFAVKQAGKNTVAQFLLACFLLGILAWFPFTGWIIGYFLSAYMLERAVWMFPFGISLVYTALAIRDHGKAKHLLISPDGLLLIVTAIAIGVFALYINENNLPDLEKFTEKSQRYQGLAAAGQELDRRITDHAIVVGSQQLNDFIPGISSKSKILTFRISQKSNMAYFSDAQREARISGVKKLFSNAPSPEEKMLLLQKYHIRFLLLQKFDLRFFEDLIASYPGRVDVTEIGGVILLQINEQDGG